MSREAELVMRFLDALNSKDIESVRSMMVAGAPMIYPGGVMFTDVTEFFEWTKTRYRNATYSYSAIDEVAAGETPVVYAKGAIGGELNSGARFNDIRVLDRFEFVDGRIARKEAWSDMSDYLRRSKA